jgi:hypothetical protein
LLPAFPLNAAIGEDHRSHGHAQTRNAVKRPPQ